MQTDINGCDISLKTQDAVAQWNAMQRAFLSHGAATPELLGAVLKAEPEFALGHAVKGLLYLSLGRSELRPTVMEALELAQNAAAQGDVTARERRFIVALGLAVEGHMGRAAAVLDDVVRTTSGDALAMKLVQALRFMLGDAAGMRASIVLAKPGFAGDHSFRGFVLGCEAFALEETGDYAGAERAGRAGLELAPDDAWGLHAVAHVHDMTGRAEDGVRWLAGRSSHWAHCNNFGYHVWWHLALFHLDRGAYGPVLELYDRKVRPTQTDDFRDISNAASLLYRLEVEGVDVGTRWEELAELSANRIDDGALIFADLHYLMALAATDRGAELETMTQRIARDAASMEHDQHEVAALTGLPMAQGLLALRDGHYGLAAQQLQHGLAFLPRAGGSHAQRDVFWRLAVEATLKAGDCSGAETLLTRRVLDRGAEDGYTARRREQIAARRADLAAAGIAAE
ncbi:tetratricopeptide repeat protein [Pontivivens insulae]|uniref:Tetratricopeptide repeat protein 38 n=1 Tax=Pontivivens insulae TaxID=1639689 RepID=A0A2R8AFK9_9RHOB|nr:tetratricopeptide repeat protein [Pontivivens insulae]RED12104.1 hypothetical protein DFR53_2817 [Pontivivens insulae]SPF30860.1 hypothetical protein POI8812_03204 [Pontivivens insulae]